MMNEYQVLDLWEKRFKRILKLEVESHQAYRLILKRYKHLLDNSRFKPLIRKVIRDEATHIDIARNLLKIVQSHKKYRKTKAKGES